MNELRGRALSVVAMCMLSTLMAAGNATGSVTVKCSVARIPVALTDGVAADQTVWGKLCVPAEQKANTVELLVSGSTYGHLYWDFPYQQPRYSYVRALASAGYATFNYDRLGVGHSSYPPSPLLTVDSDAFVAHELVQRLLHHGIAGQRFKRVVIAGHSHGSIVALLEAARYADVKGVVLTGLLHNISLDGVALAVAKNIEPAMNEPRFAKRPIDPGYISYKAGFRYEWIHGPSDDRRLVALDEGTKETQSGFDEGSEGEFGLDSANVLIGSPIHVPVLIAVGRYDRLFCSGVGATDCSNAGTVRAAEAPYFDRRARLQTFVLPDSGHTINLARNASTWYAQAIRWMRTHIGT